MGQSWGLLGRIGDVLGRLGALLGPLGGLLVPLGPVLGPIGPSWRLQWGRPGASWAVLGPLGERLGASWGSLGTFWGGLAGLLVPKDEKGRLPQLIWGVLGRISGPFFVCFGCMFKRFVCSYPILS